ncbi:MAG: (2Fe-2S) ferredoxin domain-containing protein [Peptococcaceae bacterium]|nr:(2Fe-2S) ferredoxin domain-containing protein [Peptococcaceae bacterium]
MSERLNSYEALKAKRDSLQQAHDTQENPVEIRVAMGTCAIATGAKEVLDVIEAAIEENGLDNVVLKATGCMGYCYAEPTVEVAGIAVDPVMFGYVDTKIARDIVEQYVMKQEPVDARIDTCHVNA